MEHTKRQSESEFCTYTFSPLQLVRVITFTKKGVDDVIGDDEMWANTPKTSNNIRCEKCEHNTAFYKQIQTRGGDEPMTEVTAIFLMPFVLAR
jgi:DNA-directed RNA polymerase III subunit RPC11